MGEKNRHITLFKDKPKKTVDNKVFDMMTAAADKTDVNLEKSAEIGKSSDSIHTALMAAGMTPAYGNIADLADATLYALEGELGNAAWSAAAAIPIIGQMVSGKRALKAAKEAGEEMVTLYRGIQEWHPSKHMLTGGKSKGKIIRTGESMVSDGKFVGGGAEWEWGLGRGVEEASKSSLWVSSNIDIAKSYMRRNNLGGGLSGRLLEFEVPKSYFKKHFKKTGWSDDGVSGFFPSGIPVPFLKKVHK